MDSTLKTLKYFIFEQVSQQHLLKEDARKYLEEIISLEKRGNLKEDIAIVGLACRFPKAPSADDFWSNLIKGVDTAGNFSPDRKEDILRISEPIWQEYHHVKTRPGCFLERIDLFDHEFFGISPAEAKVMAPSQRLFLEVAWEAIENAGYTRQDIAGSETGVYVGYSASWGYERLVPSNDPNVEIGNTPAMIASRLNYTLNLKGPSLLIDTTCSSSLVALHTACQALLSKDCKQAIVGGVSVILLPVWDELAAMGNEASDGRCKAFDIAADGTNVAEGLGVVIIKPLSQAIADGNFIHGVIKGSAINSDAKSNGLTAPNPQAQTEVICKAWNRAHIDPRVLSYIEAHGTGTKLGDPIEIKALSDAFKQFTSATSWCPLGSVKSNIGHLDAAAGIASIIKVILSMQHQQIPASLHFHQPNPYIDFKNSAVFVNRELTPWKSTEIPRLAGISAFGITGTNAHVVLQEAPQVVPSQIIDPTEEVFCLSARSEESLWKLIKKYDEGLEEKQKYTLTDICFTLGVCREHYPYRMALSVSSYEQLRQALRTCVNNKATCFNNKEVHYACIRSSTQGKPLSIAFGDTKSYIDAYIKGLAIDLTHYYKRENRKIIPLPNTPFESQRHWPSLEVPVQKTSSKSDPDSYLFDLTWIPQERRLDEQLQVNSMSGTWLVFCPPSSLGEKLVKALKNHGCRVICMFSGTSFAILHDKEDSFVVNPRSFSNYNEVFDNIGQETLKGLVGIIHAWSFADEDKGMSSLERITSSPFEGAYSAFYLAKLLRQYQLNQNLQLTVLTSLAHKVNAEDHTIYPSKAVLVGLNKVIMQELPKISTYCIDMNVQQMSDELVISAILQELMQPVKIRDDLVAYRNGIRHLQYLCQMDGNKKGTHEIHLQENDVYLFAGGAGYLGIQTCMFLARKQKNIKFVLLNRSFIPPRSEWDRALSSLSPDSRLHYQIQGIKEIERLGSEIIWKQVDVTDEKVMIATIEDIRRTFGHIDGVLVAMKHINVKTIEDMSMEEYQAAILSKLRGTWLLDQLTLQDTLRFFINFSSISSVMGGPINSDCASANTFLDAFGDWRNMQGRPTITLNLTEILTEDKKGSEHKITMLPPITYDEFLDCVARVLERRLPFSVIAAFDYKIMKVVLERIKIRFAPELLQKIQACEEKAPSENSQIILSKDQIGIKLTEIWKEVLGYENLSSDADFFDCGGSSLSALKLLRLIEANLGVKFEVADLYNYSTVNQMQERICELKGVAVEDALMNLLENLEKETISLEEAASALLQKE